MPAQGEARRYDEQSMFVLEIDGIEQTRLESVSEFVEESGLVEQREGGNKDVASKVDGVRNFTPITCVRGASNDTSIYDWFQEMKTFGSREAERNVSIVQLNPDGTAKSRRNLIRAWCGRYQKGPNDATADEFVKEEFDLHFHAQEFIPES